MLSAIHPTAAPDGQPDHRVALASAGDEAAFSELVREHQQMIHALTYRMTGSAEDAADLAQETFVKAWQRLHTFRTESSFGTWIHRIALNLCLNWRQRHDRSRQLQEALEHEPPMSLTPAEGSCDAEAERACRVNEALQRLRPADRAAVVLTVFEGLNHAEAAKQLDCAETTVSWRVWQARRKLKKWLADLGPAALENRP